MRKFKKMKLLGVFCLVVIAFTIGVQVSKFNAEPIQGAYNGLVSVFEAEIDAGTLTEEQILEDIRKGYINDECDIGQFIVQGYLTEYKDTLMAEGLLSQVNLDWAEEHYGSGKKTGQTSTTPQTTTEPTPTPTPEAPVSENNEVSETEADVTQEEPVEVPVEETEPIWTETENIPPTCTEDGYIRYTSDTGETKADTFPATGHDYQSEITQRSTCTENGIKTFTCKKCGDAYTEEYPLAAHEWEEDITTAGFFKEGLKMTYCKNCGEISDEVAIPHTCPIPVPLFIVLVVLGAAAVIAIIVFIVISTKKRKGRIVCRRKRRR